MGERSHPNPQTVVCLHGLVFELTLTLILHNQESRLLKVLDVQPLLSLEPFWTGNHGDVGHAVMAGERRLVAGGGVRALQAAGAEGP